MRLVCWYSRGHHLIRSLSGVFWGENFEPDGGYLAPPPTRVASLLARAPSGPKCRTRYGCINSENAGARDDVLDGGDSTTRPVLANVANVVAGSAPEATAVKPRSWNHKREGLILRQVVEEVLLTRESSRGRALAPNELSEEDLAWRRSSERRRITDAQWKQIVAKCKAKGFAEHHASAQFLKANKMTKIFDDLGIEKSLRAGSRPAELSVKTLEMFREMCPSTQDKEEQRKRALVRANCALEALIHREEDMENEFEVAQDVELDELGEWGQAAFAALNELRKDADKLDLELVDRERLRGLYQAMSALRDNILKACGASSWVRSAYEELASTHHSSPSQPSQSSSGRPSQGDPCANDRDDAVDTDEPQKKKRRTLGKGAGSDDAKVNHDCAVRWLRSRLERIARTTKEVSEIGMKLIRSHTRQMPQLSWFCVWHDGTSKTDDGSVWTRDGGVLLALHRWFAGLEVLQQHRGIIKVYVAVSKILRGEDLSMQDIASGARSGTTHAPTIVRRSHTTEL